MANLKGNKSNILSIDEKIQLVGKHFDENQSFKKLSSEYNISYSAARSICTKYSENGKSGLIRDYRVRKDSRTGKVSRTNNVDPKDREIALLRKENKRLKLEAEITKKLNQLREELNK